MLAGAALLLKTLRATISKSYPSLTDEAMPAQFPEWPDLYKEAVDPDACFNAMRRDSAPAGWGGGRRLLLKQRA